MELEKIRNLSDDELRHQERTSAEQLFRLRFQVSMGQNDGVKKLRELRKEIAQIKTIARERELGIHGEVKEPKEAAPGAEPKAAKTERAAPAADAKTAKAEKSAPVVEAKPVKAGEDAPAAKAKTRSAKKAAPAAEKKTTKAKVTRK
jgi:large subunit ribosomal protein L29